MSAPADAFLRPARCGSSPLGGGRFLFYALQAAWLGGRDHPHRGQGQQWERNTVAAIDRKSICGGKSESHKAYHLVSVFAAENQLVLGELVTEEGGLSVWIEGKSAFTVRGCPHIFEEQSNQNEWESSQTVEKNAGRIEKRIYQKIKDISWLKEHK